MSHLNGLFPSWTDATCLFISLFWEKLWSQILHLNGLFPSWIALMCRANVFLFAKILPHISHRKMIFPSAPDELISNLLVFLEFNFEDLNAVFIWFFFINWLTISHDVTIVNDYVLSNDQYAMLLIVTYEHIHNLDHATYLFKLFKCSCRKRDLWSFSHNI